MSETKKTKLWNPAIESLEEFITALPAETVDVDVMSSHSPSQSSAQPSSSLLASKTPSPNIATPKKSASPKAAEQQQNNDAKPSNPNDFYKNFQRIFTALQSQNIAPVFPPKLMSFPPLLPPFPIPPDADRLQFMRLLQGMNRFPPFPGFPTLPSFPMAPPTMRPQPPPMPPPSATKPIPVVSTHNPIVASVLGFNSTPSFNVCADCSQHFRTCGDLTQHIRNNHRSSRKRRLEPTDD